MQTFSRRALLASTATLAGVAAAGPLLGKPRRPGQDAWFQISLAQWSLHRTLRSGKLDNLDFARYAKHLPIRLHLAA